MVSQCAIPSCKAYPTKSRPVKYYSVPADKTRRQLWLDRCPFLGKFTDTQLYNVKICTKHFAPHYISETNRLTKDALPTENLHETDLAVIPYDHNQVSNTETSQTLAEFSSSSADLSCNLPNSDFVEPSNSNTLCFEVSALPSSSKADDQTRNCLASTSDSMPTDKIPVSDMLNNTETVTPDNMSNRKCCVPGCLNSLDTYANLHKFPNPAKDKELFNTWVCSIGGEILKLENEQIFKYRRVCHGHFDQKYWCRNNRLSYEAVPTRNMPDKEESWWAEEQMDGIETSTDADDVTTPAPREYPCYKPPEFSWQRPPEAIPCADDVEAQTDVSPTAPDSAGRDGGDDRRPIESSNDRLHVGYKCNECGSEIVGYRYTCVQCCGVELCGACEASGAHPEHYVLRLPRPERAGKLHAVLETLRGLMELEPLQALHEVKKEEVDDADPLCGVVPPEPFTEDDDSEFEEYEENEEPTKEARLPLDDKLSPTDLRPLNVDFTSNTPTDAANIQHAAHENSPDKVCHDVGNRSSRKVLLRLKKLSELNDNSAVKCIVVRPCEGEIETQNWARAASGASVTKLGPGVAKSGPGVTAVRTLVVKSGPGVTKLGTGVVKSGLGVTKLGTEVAKSGPGVTKLRTGVVKSGLGVTKLGTGVVKSGLGVTKLGTGVVKSGLGVTKLGTGVVKSGLGVTKLGTGVVKSGLGVTKLGTEVAKSGPRVTTMRTGVPTSGASVTTLGASVTSVRAGSRVSGTPFFPW